MESNRANSPVMARSRFRARSDVRSPWRIVAALALSAALGGCSLFDKPWPPEGGGGFGEYEETQDPRALAQQASLASFQERGAAVYAASDFDEARQLYVRVRRELAAELLEDAADDMDRLDNVLMRIDERMRRARR